MIVDMKKFVEDYKTGKLVPAFGGNPGYNLTHYIYNFQGGTKLWDYVNQDVYIEFVPEDDWFYIEDYNNGQPNWVHKAINDMLKAVKNA